MTSKLDAFRQASLAWPSSPESFLPLPSSPSSEEKGAVLEALAVCTAENVAKTSFLQGEPILICTEWRLTRATRVLSIGIILRNEKGETVFGKETFQMESAPTISQTPPLWRVRSCYRLTLRLSPGRYNLTVRLSELSPQDFEKYRRGDMGTETLLSRMNILGDREEIAKITVQPWPGEQTHHLGVTDLVEDLWVDTILPQGRPLPRSAFDGNEAFLPPALIHVTHQKAGSQWVHRILRAAFPKRIVPPQPENKHFLASPVKMGKVYPTVYVTKEKFEIAQLPPRWYRFVIVRDLRDTLVSAYFSIKYSHPPVGPIPQWRSLLHSLDKEEGMLWVLREWLPEMAKIQLSWWYAGEPIFKYEDLLQRDVEILSQILITEAKWPLTLQRLEEIVASLRFERVTNRRRGEENPLSHERKGIAGDWKNHFTPRLKEAFKAYYGGVLVALGYEKDLNW